MNTFGLFFFAQCAPPTGNEYVSASAGNDVCREGEFWILSRQVFDQCLAPLRLTHGRNIQEIPSLRHAGIQDSRCMEMPFLKRACSDAQGCDDKALWVLSQENC